VLFRSGQFAHFGIYDTEGHKVGGIWTEYISSAASTDRTDDIYLNDLHTVGPMCTYVKSVFDVDGRLDEISESGVASPLKMGATTFGNYRIKAGVNANLVEKTLENDKKLTIFGDVALSFSDDLFDDPIPMTVGGNATTFNSDIQDGGVAFHAGLGIDIANTDDNVHFTAKFRFIQGENSTSSYSVTAGLSFKM